MAAKEICWPMNANVVFHGRNGTGLCAGLRLTLAGDKVTLTPLTRRNKPANCHIDVPTVMLPEVLQALGQMLPRTVRKPSCCPNSPPR